MPRVRRWSLNGNMQEIAFVGIATLTFTLGATAPAQAALYKIKISGHVTSVDSLDLNSVGINVGDKAVFEATIDFSRATDQYPSDPDLFQAQNFYAWSAKYGKYKASSDQRGNYVGRNDAIRDGVSFSSFEPIPGPGDFDIDLPPIGYSWRGVSNIILDDTSSALATIDPTEIMALFAAGSLSLGDFNTLESHMAFQADDSEQYTRASASIDEFDVKLKRVPVPGTLGLLGLGLTGLGALRHRKQQPAFYVTQAG
jgi:hypothetical protein